MIVTKQENPEYTETGGDIVDKNSKTSSVMDISKMKVRHIMADGSILDSVEGYKIPYNETTKVIYMLAAKYAQEHTP